MSVTGDEMHAQVEPSRLQQSHQSRNGRLPTVSLVGRDHGCRYTSPFAELPLAETTLDPGQLEQCGRRRGYLMHLCHDTIVSGYFVIERHESDGSGEPGSEVLRPSRRSEVQNPPPVTSRRSPHSGLGAFRCPPSDDGGLTAFAGRQRAPRRSAVTDVMSTGHSVKARARWRRQALHGRLTDREADSRREKGEDHNDIRR